MSGGGYEFSTLVATEPIAAARFVVAFAETLHRDQAKTWEQNKATGEVNKPRPATFAECLAKSRQIRIKRERDSTYWNDLVSRRPIH